MHVVGLVVVVAIEVWSFQLEVELQLLLLLLTFIEIEPLVNSLKVRILVESLDDNKNFFKYLFNSKPVSQQITSYPNPYQSFNNGVQYGSTTTHYMAPTIGVGGSTMVQPPVPEFAPLPPPPPYEASVQPQQHSYNPNYTNYVPVPTSAPPPGYSEKS